MGRELDELIRLSRAAGADPDWVQGGGGNSSVKSADGRSIWVKASGTTLAGMDAERGWAELDLAAAAAVLDEPGLAAQPAHAREESVLALLQAAVKQPRGARPSVESSMHALLDRVVVHTHAIHMTAFLCSRESRARWCELIGGFAPDALYVPYVDPGFTLATRLREELAGHVRAHGCKPSVILLENHGVFTTGDSVEECLALHERVLAAGKKWAGGKRVNPVRFEPLQLDARSGDAEYPICANDVAAFASATRSGMPGHVPHGDRFAKARVRGALLRGGAQPRLVREDDSPTALELLHEEPALRRLATGGAFTPDQIAYCRTLPVVFEAAAGSATGASAGPAAAELEPWSAAVERYRERHGVDPKVVFAPGVGIFHAAADLAELRVVAETHRLAMTAVLRSERAGGPRFLDRQQTAFIEEWEVERYRAALIGGAAQTLLGRIASLLGDDVDALAVAREALHAAGAVVVEASVPMAVVLASFGGLDLVVATGSATADAAAIEPALALLRAQGMPVRSHAAGSGGAIAVTALEDVAGLVAGLPGLGATSGPRPIP